jgi:hypothetical protein
MHVLNQTRLLLIDPLPFPVVRIDIDLPYVQYSVHFAIGAASPSCIIRSGYKVADALALSLLVIVL